MKCKFGSGFAFNSRQLAKNIRYQKHLLTKLLESISGYRLPYSYIARARVLLCAILKYLKSLSLLIIEYLFHIGDIFNIENTVICSNVALLLDFGKMVAQDSRILLMLMFNFTKTPRKSKKNNLILKEIGSLA